MWAGDAIEPEKFLPPDFHKRETAMSSPKKCTSVDQNSDSLRQDMFTEDLN